MAKKHKKSKSPLPGDDAPLPEESTPDSESPAIPPEIDATLEEDAVAPVENEITPLDEGPEKTDTLPEEDTGDSNINEEDAAPEDFEFLKPPAPPEHKKEPFIRASTLFLILLILGLSGALYYQNQEKSKTVSDLQKNLSGMQSQLDSLDDGKLDDQSGRQIAQAVKSLSSEVRTLKQEANESAPDEEIFPPSEPPELITQPAPGSETQEGDIADSEIAEAPQPFESAQEIIEEPSEEPEVVEEEIEVSEATDEEPTENFAEETEPAEEPAPVEMDEVIESAPQVAELSSPAEEEEPPPSKVQRNRATREYLDFIENSAVKFGELMKLGLQKTRDYLADLVK
jgi:hypothetical protein